MNDSVFLDTNVLIYSYSITEDKKRLTAQKLIANNNSFISTQVLQELTNIVTKKFGFSYQDALQAIDECCRNSQLTINSKETIISATNIANRYGFSFYDSMIISSALETGCSILYSEDLNNGQIIEKRLKIINPFK